MRKITYSVAQLRALYHPSQPPANFYEFESAVGTTRPFNHLSFSESTNLSNISACSNSTQRLIKSNNNQNHLQNNLTKSQSTFRSNQKSTSNWEPDNNYKALQKQKMINKDNDAHLQNQQNEAIRLNEDINNQTFQKEVSYYQSTNPEVQNNYITNSSLGYNIYQNQNIQFQQQQQQLIQNQNNLMQGFQPNATIQPIQQMQSPYLVPSQYINPMLPPFNALQMQQINFVQPMQPMQPMQFVTPLPQMVSGIPFQVPQISPYTNGFQSNYNSFSPYEQQSFASQNNFSQLQQPPQQPFYPEQASNSYYYQANNNYNMNIPVNANNNDGGSNFPHLMESPMPIPNNINSQPQISLSDSSDYYYQGQPFIREESSQQPQEYYPQQPQPPQEYFSSTYSSNNNIYQNDTFGSVLTNNKYQDSGQASNYSYDQPCNPPEERENQFENFNTNSKSESPIIENFESVLNTDDSSPQPSGYYYSNDDSSCANFESPNSKVYNTSSDGFIEISCTAYSSPTGAPQNRPEKGRSSSSSPASLPAAPFEFVPISSKQQTPPSSPDVGAANDENVGTFSNVSDYSKPTFNPQKLGIAKPANRNKYS